jgi:hypothetical protein
MEITLIIISALSLITIIAFFYFYSKNEKKNKVERVNDLKEITTKIEETTRRQLAKITEIANQQNEKYGELSKDVKTFQEQANTKINSGFEQLQNENSNIQKDVKEKVADIKSSFKDYSQKVQEILTKYSDDLHQSKLDSNRLKEEMQTEINNLLKEIKAPLDLD